MKKLVLMPLVIIFSSTICISCSSNNSKLSDDWIKPPPNSITPSQATPIAKNKVYFVAPNYYSTANKLLGNQEFVLVESAELKKIVPLFSPQIGLKPYLVRCVSIGDPASQCIIRTNNQGILWVDTGILTHNPVEKLYHTPVVVLLKSQPKNVYVTFSAAE